LEQSQILLTTINPLLKLLHVVPCYLWHVLELLVRDCRKDAAEIKQFILDPLEIRFEFFNLNMPPNHLGIHHSDNPDHRIQLIQGAVGLNSETVLQYLRPALFFPRPRFSCRPS
jgi:hypothetical protein